MLLRRELIDPFRISDPKPNFNIFLRSQYLQTLEIRSNVCLVIYSETIASSIACRPAPEAIERDDEGGRRSDRNSGPAIRRVPSRVFLTPTTTSSRSTSPSPPVHHFPPFPLLPFTSKSRTRSVQRHEYRDDNKGLMTPHSRAFAEGDAADTARVLPLRVVLPARVSDRQRTEPSPPPVQRSPKKNARPASPINDKKSSPSARGSPKKKARIASPFESPPQAKKTALDPLQQWLDAAPPGIPRSTLMKMMTSSPSKGGVASDPFIDDEAMDEDGTDDARDVQHIDAVEDEEDDSGSDLGGFIQRDDVIEYDSDAPALPDDEDAESAVEEVTPRRRRIYKRAESHEEDTDESEIEIVPINSKAKVQQPSRLAAAPQSTSTSKADKGKGRAVSPAAQGAASAASEARSRTTSKADKGKGRAASPRIASGSGSARPSSHAAARVSTPNPDDHLPEWKKLTLALQRVSRGLHVGSTAVDIRARVLDKLVIDPTDADAIFTWDSVPSANLAGIRYYDGIALVPANCEMVCKKIQDGLPYPTFDSLVDPGYVNIDNLMTGVKFVRLGPYINDSIVNPSDVIAVDVTGSSTTSRFRLVLKDTRAPAVSITPGVIRWWKLDTPSLGVRPVFFVNLSPIDGHFERVVAFLCMVFGTPVLHSQMYRNAIRFATLPAFDRPSTTPARKVSKSLRASSSGTAQARSFPFEPTTTDGVNAYDARTVELPADMSTWPYVLPRLEEPYPRNAVAFVVHTTTVWVATSSGEDVYNLQQNLMYVVVVGVLPPGLE
ncbi:hypothetical protein K525DRAFT_273109 [Schizophyllum commune Loenen D]|nr:hypothetical protein K525DRAFT_273109 [Schizophyllum commune Loenen D]